MFYFLRAGAFFAAFFTTFLVAFFATFLTAFFATFFTAFFTTFLATFLATFFFATAIIFWCEILSDKFRPHDTLAFSKN